jgi:glycosyltransferase involved in cell wall biosynthesis
MSHEKPPYGRIWNGVFTNEPCRRPKISLCTTVMNRLPDLQQTLPANLIWETYPNIEFVILDYNSSDGLSEWVRKDLISHVESGRLIFARTEEPRYFSMTHSRNLAFKIATGEICINVDADNFLYDRSKHPALSFGEFIARCASQQPSRAIFAKGKRLCHGRLGFYKHEFTDLLGGYNEEITGYGHDEIDLMYRAWGLDFTLMYCGGQYVDRLHTSREKKNSNLKENWRVTESRNKSLSYENLARGIFKANEGREWGKGRLLINWQKDVTL